MELRGWEQADVILFSADAYVDHPAFGASVIGRLLEAEGLRVAIVPQPDWHGDFRDFKKLGRPRLFFGISPGAMDSMVNKYTAARRLRSEDAYSPDGRHDLRPEYPTIVYTNILRKLFPDVPIVLGGIEASLRRVMHYDYWQEKFMPSILIDSDADIITYGMGEKPTLMLADKLSEAIADYHSSLFYDENGESYITRDTFHDVIQMKNSVPQTVSIYERHTIPEGIKKDDIVLHSFEDCLSDLKLHADNFRHVEEESNKLKANRLLQETKGKWVVVNPPFPPLTQQELDHSFDL
ncbi:MAG: YgiQ family radical SAM protein, partial [Bacteroidaceae bacterium]|nr:YgiQ family radical SAM protein [Bacteroidaceae bacterium]